MVAPIILHYYSPTTIEDWERSDKYHNSFLLGEDPVLDAVVKKNSEEGLPDIAVSDAQAKFLSLIAKSIGAKRILEVGTLGGYSAICFARALPEDGKVVTLELNEKFANVARENAAHAGFGDKIEVITGPAAESLKALQPDPPFDLAFIDADKEGNVTYFTEAKRLVRKGGIIIVDNVVWNARPADPTYSDSLVEGIRSLLNYIKDDKEVEATTIATVGDKGYDGFLYAIRK